MKTRFLTSLLLGLLVLAIFANFLGALSPELGFDALWYHLTIPKIYLESGKIFYIPGGLLYYSAMPRLAEFLYIPLLKLAGDTGPHLLNFLAGIGTVVLLYKLARTYFDKLTSLLVTTLFYVTPLVGWQSGSAYVDLLRTFFETAAFFLIIKKRIVWAGILLGFAIGTKTLALGSVPLLLLVLYLHSRKLRECLLFSLTALLVCFPWFLSAYVTTGYPFFPIGTNILDSSHHVNFDFWNTPIAYFKLFITPSDVISPIYVLFLPFLFFMSKKAPRKTFTLFLAYFVCSILIWFIIPRTGGGRFILPYLPIWSLLVGFVLYWQKTKTLQLLLTCLIIGSIGVNLLYRTTAVSRNLPYLVGRQTKEEFLCKRLDFTTSVFVDCDGFFKRTLKPTDLVLIKDVHNLFYVDFPFVHKTWYNGEHYTYVLTQKAVPHKKPLYHNPTTNMYLYKK